MFMYIYRLYFLYLLLIHRLFSIAAGLVGKLVLVKQEIYGLIKVYFVDNLVKILGKPNDGCVQIRSHDIYDEK